MFDKKSWILIMELMTSQQYYWDRGEIQ